MLSIDKVRAVSPDKPAIAKDIFVFLKMNGSENRPPVFEVKMGIASVCFTPDHFPDADYENIF